MTMLKWSAQQRAALSRVGAWLADPSAPKVFRLSGYAGTGKTTLAKHMAEGVKGNVYFAAYTGKAASVLKRMGCVGASTIHSLIYSVSDPDRTRLHEMELELAAMKTQSVEECDPMVEMDLEQSIIELREELRQPRFSLQENSALQDAALVVIDESSMIDHALAADLESFPCKILVMGDPAQLPPVKGTGHYDMDHPDIYLTEIHRQAAENPIVRWATAVREGEELAYRDEGAARKVRKKSLSAEELIPDLATGQCLVGKNVTRTMVNTRFRQVRNKRDPYPEDGDKLVVLKNNRDYEIMNGVTCMVTSAVEPMEEEPDGLRMTLMYEDRAIPDLPVDKWHFDYHAPDEYYQWNERGGLLPMDFGYALTVHKAQGSQWDRVVVVDDGFGTWDKVLRKRWLYTAITRAQHELIILA